MLLSLWSLSWNVQGNESIKRKDLFQWVAFGGTSLTQNGMIHLEIILSLYSPPSLSFSRSHFSFSFFCFLPIPTQLPLHFTVKDFEVIKLCETKFGQFCSFGELNTRKTWFSNIFNEPVDIALKCTYLLDVKIWRFFFFILPTNLQTVWQLSVAGSLTNSRCLKLEEEIMLQSLGLL